MPKCKGLDGKLKSQKMPVDKLHSSCFLFKLFSNLKFENSRARALEVANTQSAI